jgi:hypothetical protein
MTNHTPRALLGTPPETFLACSEKNDLGFVYIARGRLHGGLRKETTMPAAVRYRAKTLRGCMADPSAARARPPRSLLFRWLVFFTGASIRCSCTTCAQVQGRLQACGCT